MKLKIFTLALFNFLLISNLFSCPVWIIGKMYVVDENNKFINAKVWRFDNKDSTLLDKGSRWGWQLDDEDANSIDTNVFEFYGGGGWAWIDDEAPEKVTTYYRIKADGYADVILKDINFREEEGKGLPVLYIKMYPKKFIKVGNKLSLIERYVYDKDIVATDTMEINFSNYIQNIQTTASSIMVGDNETMLMVESYPNPVTDYLILKINSTVTEPYTLKLMDMQGKLVKQTALTTQETKYDLQWQTKGNYIVLVYDPKGNPIFSRQFVKM